MRAKLTIVPLVLLMISAIDSNRNLPSIAIFGSPMIFYFLFATLFFLLPTALVSAELSSSHPDKEGVFHWVRHAFGEKWAMAAIWLQWINTVVWFPTILSFITGALAFLIDPALINSKTYMIVSITVVFWGLTAMNLRGLHISARVNNVFVVLGTLMPMCFLVLLGFLWYKRGQPIQIDISLDSIVPQIAKVDTWVALVAVIGSFLGVELASVHLAEVHHPQRLFPLALFVSTIAILATMLFGALTIAAVLPEPQINLAGGIMQVFDSFFQKFHLRELIPIATFFIILGSIGGLINWMISPSKGLLFAAKHGFLPTYFTKENSQGVASRVLVIQAVIVTLLCGVMFYVPSVNGFYWFLSALSTGLYMLMYFLIFIAALRLRKHLSPSAEEKRFIIPGGKIGLWITCLFGLFGSLLTFCLGFVPPSNVDIGSPYQYTCMIGGGMVVFIAPLLLTFYYKQRS